jgi:hypothetical protein
MASRSHRGCACRSAARETRWVCDKFIGKRIRQLPDAPRNPPIGCS